MTNKNNKVPIAILSCFLIAFILQGVLKLSGILVFEKALDWNIFSVIDKYKILQLILYSCFNILTVYCMAFALTSKPYSKKWYHYASIILFSVGVVAFRMFATYTQQVNILLDVLLYIVVPFAINITTDKTNRLFEKMDIFAIVTTLSINIFLYFGYLGVTYWSNILTSLIPIKTVWLTSSTNFLIRLEIYIGMITLMLSLNMLIQYFKRRINMNMPMDIATDEAKVKELEEKKAKKNSKKNEK